MSSASDARGAHPERSHPLGEIRALCDELDGLARDMQQAEINGTSLLQGIGPRTRASACNLIHYLAFRRHDLRHLQSRLTALGLSSLGRSEAGILESVNTVRRTLQALEGDRARQADTTANQTGTQNLLTEHAQSLLGAAPAHRSVRIMVTMPAEAAEDYTLVHDLLKGGMDCMRINCAHDDRAAWSRMIAHLRRASEALGRPCQVAMDLAGPKLRTGPLRPGPAVVKIRPDRDVFGRVTGLARVWLTTDSNGRPPPSLAHASLPVAAAWLNALKIGDHLDFEDARGAARTLRVVDVTADGVWTETAKTAYVVPGMRLFCREIEADGGFATVGELPLRVEPLILAPGDHLVVTRGLEPGRPATRDGRGQLLTPASIGCTLPKAFDDVRPGDAIWFDDGKIGGVVERIEADRVIAKITRARERGGKLLGDKGINLPDSALKLPALTKEDVADLEFVVKNADIVSLSFANSASDVELLHEQLKRLGGEKLGVILKIETRRGFENLPEMLFAALRFKRCGVMIARGDLAVECGFERLAEVQEEILWICEAAHVPVIWATQVLESLAKEGFPSRAEITDAAMSERAECVMLNKGPHICAALAALDDILRRMQNHVTKKRSIFRSLRLADRFFSRRGIAPVHGKGATEKPSTL